MIPFRTLCAKLRTVIKALTPEERAGLGDGLPSFVDGSGSYSYRIDASDFLMLCARVGIDPLTGERLTPITKPGALCLSSIGAGCAVQRGIRGLTREQACAEIGIGRATLWRLETKQSVSVESILAVCEFIGVHPFGYLAPEKRRAAA
jgi:hypothetical protein